MISTNEDKRVLVNCTFGKRLKSYFIDIAVMFPIFIILMTIVLILLAEIAHIQPQFDPYKYGNIVAIIFLFILYPAIKDVPFKEGSVGNKVMHIEILDMKTGEKPKKIKLFIRNIFFVNMILEYIFSAFRLDRRTLGDLISNTRTVYKETSEKNENNEMCE